ncbi:MAG: carotenoid oxygenase [Linnemannia gamsii]|nr:MAG: carotenoid oxygenase [Linnemannia gamsii]
MAIPSKECFSEGYKENRPQSRQSGTSRVPVDVRVKPEKRTVAHSHPYLSGNFYPVFEETVGEEGIECEVIGVIPESLRGSQYIRTGPNSLHIPEETVAHHFFDGEGMLHGVYFPPSVEGEDETGPIRARYMNRYVRSDSFQKANKHGNVMLSVGLMMNGGRSLIKILKQATVSIFRSMIFSVTNIGNGNTGMAFIGSRLLALHEAGVPIETAVPSLATVGEFYFEQEGQKRGKQLLPNQEACTAHPKYDPNTGETVFFSWRLLPPFAYYSVIAADGSRTIWEEPIPGFTRPTMMHDFAITPTYSIILNLNYTLDPIKNWKSNKTLIKFDSTKPARFGIIPRHFNSKRDKVLWFETRSCHMFHTANSWDEKDKDGNVVAVYMVASRSERFVSYINMWQSTGEHPFGGGKTPEEVKRQYVAPGGGDYANQDPDGTYLSLFRFDLLTMETRVTTLSTVSSEFPMINWDWFMRPDLRYIYAAKMDILPEEGMKSWGIIKVNIRAVMDKQQQLLEKGDLKNFGGDGQGEIGSENLLQVEKESHGMYLFGGRYCGNEPIFVPGLPRADGKELEEDEGHLLMYVYDESQIENGLVANPDRQITELWIFDAKKIGQEHEPVAKVKIPRRVPYGFHGLHVTRKQIELNQRHLNGQAVAL